jgi:alpha/beta superfamily hydrolase
VAHALQQKRRPVRTVVENSSTLAVPFRNAIFHALNFWNVAINARDSVDNVRQQENMEIATKNATECSFAATIVILVIIVATKNAHHVKKLAGINVHIQGARKPVPSHVSNAEKNARIDALIHNAANFVSNCVIDQVATNDAQKYFQSANINAVDCVEKNVHHA